MNDFSELKNHCYRLYNGFLKTHVKNPNLLPTKEEEDNVKAFCVLSHAAFEEYFEKISIKTLDAAYKKFKSKTFINTIPSSQSEIEHLNENISQLLKTLLLSLAFTIHSTNASNTLKTHKSKIELASQLQKNGNDLSLHEIAELTKKTDSYTKEILKESLKFFEDNVEGNHGASLKYLLKLLIPVGIDIPENLSLLNSLQKISKYRGSYAHSRGNLTNILSASDIINYVIDALNLCKIIDLKVNKFYKYSE